MHQERRYQVATIDSILTTAKSLVNFISHRTCDILAGSAQWYNSKGNVLDENGRWCLYPRGSNAEDHMAFDMLLRYMLAWNMLTRRDACMPTTPCFCSRTPGSSQGQACLMAGTLI